MIQSLPSVRTKSWKSIRVRTLVPVWPVQESTLFNGSHVGTGFTPVEVVISERKQVAFCGCKHTGTAPFCDGTHVKL